MGRYKWDKTNHALVPISTGESTNFVGTNAEWAALSSSEKANYKTVDLTDDFNGSPIDSIPTLGSENAVSSGGVYTALSDKQDELTFDNSPTANSDNPVKSSGIYNALDAKSNKVDLTNLNLTGTTNTTGSQISSGTFFYLNGTLVKAKTNIAANAAFTLNTNYEVVTAGGLNNLNTQISNLDNIKVQELKMKITTESQTLSTGRNSFTPTKPTDYDSAILLSAQASTTGKNIYSYGINGNGVAFYNDTGSSWTGTFYITWLVFNL